MKKLLTTLSLALFTIFSNAQTGKSLDETKIYIVKMINEYGWKENSGKNRLRAEFEGDLLKIFTENKTIKLLESESTYNFTNVYRFKGPIKEPGDIAHIIIWVDCKSKKQNDKWYKKDLEIDIHNYDVGEQLMIAFYHLNKLLLEKKPAIEKF